MFSEKLMDHCQNPRNVGKLDEKDNNVLINALKDLIK